MNIPTDLKYTQDHEWIKSEGDVITVGITDFAQGELGDIVYVEVETTGEELGQGDVFGTIEAVKTVSDLFMPLAGEVIEVNPELDANPEIINEDPYGKGWIIKVKATDANSGDLLSSDAYGELVGA